MRTLQLIILIAGIISACDQQTVEEDLSNEKVVEHPKTVKSSSPEFTVITVENAELGWGYQILQDGKLAIDQKHIPAIQGYKGFSTKENAEKTANFIVEKMKKGIFPPTLSEKELDSLGVL